MKRPRSFVLRRQKRDLEGPLQRNVAAMLRAYLPDEIWFTASLSGVRLSPAVAGLAKAAGMEKGAPDLSFVFPDGATRYIEMKADEGGLTAEQAKLAERLGDSFAVCRSWPSARAQLTIWLAPYGLRLLTDGESVRREMTRARSLPSGATFQPQGEEGRPS